MEVDVNDVVILSAARTPVGTFGGSLAEVPAVKLGAVAIAEALRRAGLQPDEVDEVIMGLVLSAGVGQGAARQASMAAGIPVDAPATTVNKVCGSGLKAVALAAQAVALGDGDVIVAGGMESMSSAPYTVRGARWGLKLRHTQFIDTLWEGLTDSICNLIMGETAENLAEIYEISREEQDEYAVQSHKKAFRASRMGKFKDEIVPVTVEKRVAGQKVAPEIVSEDECINPGLTVLKAALYPTVFKKDGTVTPANACPISDGAAACISREAMLIVSLTALR